MNNYQRYLLFWFSQAVSQLGSSMTTFALIIWMYTKNGSAFTVSLMTFFNYVPYVLGSLLAGPYIDTHSKKKDHADSRFCRCDLLAAGLAAEPAGAADALAHLSHQLHHRLYERLSGTCIIGCHRKDRSAG